MRNVIDPKLESFGWKTNLQKKRGTSKITINKVIATGAGLKKGQPMYCYLAKDNKGREMILTYLDGKPRDPK